MSAVRCHRRAKGADVEFWTNEQRPILNKLPINHLLPYFVDGERSMLDRPPLQRPRRAVLNDVRGRMGVVRITAPPELSVNRGGGPGALCGDGVRAAARSLHQTRGVKAALIDAHDEGRLCHLARRDAYIG